MSEWLSEVLVTQNINVLNEALVGALPHLDGVFVGETAKASETFVREVYHRALDGEDALSKKVALLVLALSCRPLQEHVAQDARRCGAGEDKIAALFEGVRSALLDFILDEIDVQTLLEYALRVNE